MDDDFIADDYIVVAYGEELMGSSSTGSLAPGMAGRCTAMLRGKSSYSVNLSGT